MLRAEAPAQDCVADGHGCRRRLDRLGRRSLYERARRSLPREVRVPEHRDDQEDDAGPAPADRHSGAEQHEQDVPGVLRTRLAEAHQSVEDLFHIVRRKIQYRDQ